MLERWSKRPKTPMSVAQRARIVLLAADRLTNKAVAEKLDVNQATVVRWRKRYLERGVDGLINEPRPGAPRTISDEAVEAVVVRGPRSAGTGMGQRSVTCSWPRTGASRG